MWKRLAILTIAIFMAVYVPGQANKATDNNQQPVKQVQSPITATVSPEKLTKQDANLPRWYTVPDWWLAGIAFVTGCFICWQSWETRKAAEAANRGMEIAKTKERAKLLLRIQPLNPIFGAIPEAKLSVTNVGESSAIFGMAIAGLHISDSDTLVKNETLCYELKVGYSLLKSEESSEETVWWPAHHFVTYSQGVIEGEKEFVHLHGIINFKDAFDDWWRLKFHYIWRQYKGEIWMPHLQANITGEWENQDNEGECRIEKPSKKRWWQFWLKADSPERKSPN